MPKTVITLFGRDYPLACADGQQERLQDIAQMVDRRMRQVAGKAGNTTEQHIFLLTCLTLGDELLDAQAKVNAVSQKVEQAHVEEEDIIISAVGILREKVGNLVRTMGTA